jgi:hypothetical protein
MKKSNLKMKKNQVSQKQNKKIEKYQNAATQSNAMKSKLHLAYWQEDQNTTKQEKWGDPEFIKKVGQSN